MKDGDEDAFDGNCYYWKEIGGMAIGENISHRGLPELDVENDRTKLYPRRMQGGRIKIISSKHSVDGCCFELEQEPEQRRGDIYFRE